MRASTPTVHLQFPAGLFVHIHRVTHMPERVRHFFLYPPCSIFIPFASVCPSIWHGKFHVAFYEVAECNNSKDSAVSFSGYNNASTMPSDLILIN